MTTQWLSHSIWPQPTTVWQFYINAKKLSGKKWCNYPCAFSSTIKKEMQRCWSLINSNYVRDGKINDSNDKVVDNLTMKLYNYTIFDSFLLRISWFPFQKDLCSSCSQLSKWSDRKQTEERLTSWLHSDAIWVSRDEKKVEFWSRTRPIIPK